jgi:hypothetical protein
MYLHVDRTFLYSTGGCPEQRRLDAGTYLVGDGVSARLAAAVVRSGYGTFSKHTQEDKSLRGAAETQVIHVPENK